MTANAFVHLNIHSEYSLSDGIVRPGLLVKRCIEQQLPAVAITDFVNLYGMVKFYRACCAAGIKPIIGSEFWIKNSDDANSPDRMVLLCQDIAGYHSLCKLISRAHRHGYQAGLATIDKPLLFQYHEGLILLSGGQYADLGKALCADNPARATELCQEYLQHFGDRFYIELNRIGRPDEASYIAAAMELADQLSVPVVATNRVQFLFQSDFQAHDIRVCIHEGRVLNDSRRSKQFTSQQYLRSAGEMRALFADIPEAIDNTLQIARRCNTMLDFSSNHMPRFPIKAGEDVDVLMRRDTIEGLKDRFIRRDIPLPDNGEFPPDYQQRLEIEFSVITSMGFSGYFLIVADFIRWSRQNSIPVGPGRGSGAGSLVAYGLGITELDPIVHGLLFERFLNSERVSLPDFDIDFCMDGRDRVIEYVANTYGREKVAQIITHGTMAAKAVVRDVGRVLGMPYGVVDKIAKLIPFEIGITLESALQQEEQLLQIYEDEEEIKELIDRARELEGIVRNVGTHAGGVVIAPDALTFFTPLYCESGSEQSLTQLDKNDLEAIGLVKFDFLGLRTLTIIDNAVKLLQKRSDGKGRDLAMDKLPMMDQVTYELLQACRTTSIFQLESRGMKDLIQRLVPDCFDDLVALVALFRPGPLQSGMVDDFINRKHGREKILYPHPALVGILKPTYGVILYQEQVMQIAQVLAGYSLGAGDILRDAMGKKKLKEMQKQRSIFIAGCVENQVEEKTATYIFDLMEKFAAYGFNKSHSAAYALVTYQTAYLKAHFPAEFLCASISSDLENTERVVTLIAECREFGIAVKAPDVNLCEYNFVPINDQEIIYGLGAIKGIGKSAIESIVQLRKQNGPYQDIFDFCKRLAERKFSKRVFESLICAGAMDCFSIHRAALMATLPKAMNAAGQDSKNRQSGQSDMFGLQPATTFDRDMAPVSPWSEENRLIQEKNTLGLYLSGHPINQFRADLEKVVDSKLSELNTNSQQRQVLAGLVAELRTRNDRRGEKMAFLTLDDQHARLEVSLNSRIYGDSREIVQKDSILLVVGKVSDDDYTGGQQMRADRVLDLARLYSHCLQSICLKIELAEMASKKEELLQLLGPGGGDCVIYIDLVGGNESLKIELGKRWRVRADFPLIKELRKLCAAENVILRFSRQVLLESSDKSRVIPFPGARVKRSESTLKKV